MFEQAAKEQVDAGTGYCHSIYVIAPGNINRNDFHLKDFHAGR
jgi:hypothetical protein